MEDLILADLEATPMTRRVLEGMVSRAVRRAGEPSLAVVSDVASGGSDLDLRPGVAASSPAALLTRPELDAVGEWAWSLSEDLVAGSGRHLFPEVDGVHLGDLLRIMLQESAHKFAVQAAALERACARERPRRVTVCCADAEVARSLADAARGWGAADVRAKSPLQTRWSGLLGRWRSQGRMGPVCDTARLSAELARVGRTGREHDVLIVAESRPMLEMFEPVTKLLEPCVPDGVLQVSYVGASGNMAGAPAQHLITFARPEIGRVSRPGRYAAHWRATRASLARWSSEVAPAWKGARPPVLTWSREFASNCALLHDHVRFAGALIDAVRPRLVVVGNDRYWIGQGFVQQARRRGIRTVAVQDGVASDSPAWYSRSADEVVVSGRYYADLLLRHGVPAGAIVDAGQPRYDALIQTPPARAQARARAGLPSDAFCVLVATQPIQHPAFLAQVARAVLAVPDVTLVLRPHPSQPSAGLASVCRGLPAGRIVWAGGPSITDLLAGCDLLLTQYSTVAIGAALLGRPIITVNVSGLPDPVPYAETGLATGAKSPPEISTLVQQARDAWRAGSLSTWAGPSAQGLALLVGPTDGHAAERVAALITQAIPARR